jgi:hypothetical protein
MPRERAKEMGLPSTNKFASKKAPPKPAATKAGRFGTFTRREEGPPMLAVKEDGTPAVYRVRFESAEECLAQKPGGQNSIKSYVEVVSGDGTTPEGTRALVLHMQSQYGRADFEEQCVATAGYDPRDEVDEYVAFDPDGHFFAACVGDANDYKDLAALMVGRVVDVEVTRGKTTTDGADYYRKYRWAPVSDDDDDQATSPKIARTP